MDNYKKQLEYERQKADNQRNIRRFMPLLRQFMNSEFRVMWDNLPFEIKNIYGNEELDTSYIKRQHTINDNGVKYAILILNDKYICVSKKTCKYYLDLNDQFHPNIKPEQKIVHNCIDQLKKMAPDIPVEIDILNELDKLCLSHK